MTMQAVPPEIAERFERALDRRGVPDGVRAACRKWLRFYLDFCRKYGYEANAAASRGPFLAKLVSKGQSPAQQEEARGAVAAYLDTAALDRPPSASHSAPDRAVADAQFADADTETGGAPASRPAGELAEQDEFQESGQPYVTRPAPVETPSAAVREEGASAVDTPLASGGSWKAEYEALANAIQLRHYSPRTLHTYLHWTRRFQAFTRSKPPALLSAADVKAFLSDLAVREKVSASTQNQAFNALLFFFRHGLGREFGRLDDVVRARRKRYIPVVLSRAEVDGILERLAPPYDLIVKLLYGCGLRISECLELRVQCFNLDEGILTVHDGKGQKDRTVPLPASALPQIREHVQGLAELHRRDLSEGYAGVFLPSQLEKKYKNAPKAFIWQWFFPAKRLTHVPATGEFRRYHLQDSDASAAIRRAVADSAIPKRVSPHTFRHTFASHLLQANYDIRTIQELLGHSDVRTTMIYTHTVPSRTLKERRSPLDF